MSDPPVDDFREESDPLEAQQLLLESSLELAFSAYDEALAAKLRDPVVFLLDCEDAIGGEIARSWLGEETVADAIADRAGSDDEETETTVFAHAFSFAQCRTEVPAVFPYLSPALNTPPVDGFLAIAVTCGGASALTVPFSARP
ncbi:MAG: hypothetical protein SH868_04675 [Bythopirellula sp.]|nr:hypothetical protein [Bythopirellula sp.]